MYEIWVDGSVRDGNPGIGGIALYVKHNGICIYKNAVMLPSRCSNNQAEYEAVIAALYYLKTNNKSKEDCIITTDSQLVYGQVVQNWKCNFDHLRVLRDEAKRFLNNFPFSIELKLVGRFNNEIANELAQAITEKEKLARRDNGRI